MQNYTTGDILLTLKILEKQQIGRKTLAKFLGLGDATIRTLFRTLESQNLITSTRKGQKITEKGIHFLASVPHFTLPEPVEGGDLTLSQHNLATLIFNYAHHVKNGIQFRDAAIIAGACGATTLIFSQGKLHFPDNTEVPQDTTSLFHHFSFSENDILIMVTAETAQKALRGIAYCLSLLSQEKPTNF
jgi:predicted transcriptional regulator